MKWIYIVIGFVIIMTILGRYTYDEKIAGELLSNGVKIIHGGTQQ